MSDVNQPPPPGWGSDGSGSSGQFGQPGPPAPGQQPTGPQGGYQPPQGGYQPAQGYGYQGHAQQPQNGIGTTSLILGIVGLVTSIFFFGALLGIVAIILGFVARGKAKRGEATNGGMALGGIITGFLSFIAPIAFIILGAAIFSSSTFGFSSLTECIQSAGQDQEAIEQCQRDFEESLEDSLLGN